jgi:predicted small lipoprotein YifL
MINRLRFAPTLVILVLFATGCGQRGDLYLRESPPAGLKPERPAAAKPVPYPKEAAEDKGAGEPKR